MRRYLTFFGLISNQLTANFNASQTTSCVSNTITFTDISSGSPTTWTWSFPGGNPASSTLQNPTVSYSAAGTYSVSLIIGNGSSTHSITKTDYITVQAQAALNLMITEIMYNPPDTGDDTLEYVEIYNAGVVDAQLSGVYFSQGIVYTFPFYELQVGGYVLVCKDSVAFNNAFGIEARQWTEGALSNSGETLEIMDVSGTVLDVVAYDDSSPWPVTPDGDGPSLTFCQEGDNSNGLNWLASYLIAGYNNSGLPLNGTPGAVCEYVGIPETPAAGQLTISPNPTNGFFTLILPVEDSWKVEIFGLTGKMVYSTAVSSSVNAINTGDLPKGMYLLKATSFTDEKIVISKLIIN